MLDQNTVKVIVDEFYHASRSSHWTKVRHYENTPVMLVFNCLYVNSIPVLWFIDYNQFFIAQKQLTNDIAMQLYRELIDTRNIKVYSTETEFDNFVSMSKHLLKAYRNTEIVSGNDYHAIVKQIATEVINEHAQSIRENVAVTNFEGSTTNDLLSNIDYWDSISTRCDDEVADYADAFAIIWLSNEEPDADTLFIGHGSGEATIKAFASSCLYQDVEKYLIDDDSTAIIDTLQICEDDFLVEDDLEEEYSSANDEDY